MRRALLIGRFQPFHRGHLEALTAISREFDRVVVGIGSAQESHTLKNPFTAGERYLMIEAALEEAGITNVALLPIPDMNRNAVWVSHVTSLVPPFDVFFTNNPLPRTLFEEKGYKVQPIPFVSRSEYEGTTIRSQMLQGGPWEERVPPATAAVIRKLGGPERLRVLAGNDRA
ncbi:MAG TPA: nicotinamide-nucleotide adenylyltransferase [Candidatus Thermoplasmatota archaeon]|nr:nicotinamide-nucleotide adenylyltransferase [Candidatus Thermoplasmatota archaeon]